MGYFLRFLIHSDISVYTAIIIPVLCFISIALWTKRIANIVEAQSNSWKNIIISGLCIWVLYLIVDLSYLERINEILIFIQYALLIAGSSFILKYFLGIMTLPRSIYTALPYILFHIVITRMFISYGLYY